MVDTTACPECGELAEVQWRDVLESTDGPVEHAKVLCVRRHWFFLPVASLTRARSTAEAVPTARTEIDLGQPWLPAPSRSRALRG
jgi:hypothetical protein